MGKTQFIPNGVRSHLQLQASILRGLKHEMGASSLENLVQVPGAVLIASNGVKRIPPSSLPLSLPW
jgi:hypothetical protein